ncbi:MAG TPA: pirin family protein [Jatrophihabitans sp.]
MSNLEESVEITVCGGVAVQTEPVFELLPPRKVELTPRLRGADQADPITVSRYLPTRGRRMVGAWCFVDYYGPDDVGGSRGMQVPPHPHCGLQTVSWLLAGEVLHRDSIGSVQVISPGQLNLMTAGRGIAHAETSVQQSGEVLHGLQLWVALPETELRRAAEFQHLADVPHWRTDGLDASVLLGTLAEITSPASTFTPIVGADIAIGPAAHSTIPLRSDWEYAALVLAGEVVLDGRSRLRSADMAYLGCARSQLSVATGDHARLLLLGGEPFDEEILMWWNFVGRTHEDIVAARTDWMSGSRFGAVTTYDGAPLPAPPMPAVRLKPRGRAT